MFVKSAVAVALLSASAAAQGYNYTLPNINAVTPTVRAQWCGAEENTCYTLCGGPAQTAMSMCDSDTLINNCTCNNGSAPGLQYYTQTLPTFICEEIYNECIAAGANDQVAQAKCTATKMANCGTLDPTKYTPPASSSSSSSMSSTAAADTPSATAAVTTTTSKAAAATMAVMVAEYGTGLIAAGAAAAFGLLL